MSTRTYSTLNQNALGPGLVLSKGGLIVTTTEAALNADRCVLGTVPQGTGTVYYEAMCYTGLQPDPTPDGFLVGVGKPTTRLDRATGADADSFGYQPSTGNVMSGGIAVETFDPTPERTVIGVLLELGPSIANLSYFLGGSYAGTITLPTGQLWLPCGSVYGDAAADNKIYFNFGQTGFVNPINTVGY